MKRLAKIILQTIGCAFSFLGCVQLAHVLRWMGNQLYTGFYKRRFQHFGTESLLKCCALKLEGLQNISIGEYTVLGSGPQLTAWSRFNDETFHPDITIGNYCTIRDNTHITAVNKITIGDHLLTGTNVLITDNAHGAFTKEQLQQFPTERPLISKGPVIIGNNVWLGNNVCVMPGVTIGDGAVVGANSVVTKDIPPYSMAAGIPARVIKQL